ncbi:LysE family translocator [Helicobacter mesocricetorum]|uniref:LysE family translocator n=1 Tax=Helicobacter mesocricetorum TaxID=87012 RepID=UPI000CF13E59|nr:LysE family translocator [Helicobacter mesocricetorum]
MELLGLFLLGFVAALTPGPDILFVLRNTLSFGSKQGFLAFLGIFSGWIIFLSLIYFGLSHFFDNILLQASLNLIGGIYLFYIAYMLFKKSKNHINLHQKIEKNFFIYFKGLFINLSNPKAILFFTIIISPFINNNLEISLIILLCGLSLAFLFIIFLSAFSRNFINNAFFDKIDKICGILFLVFGVLLLFQAYKLFLMPQSF